MAERVIVCLCGSTRFSEEYQRANLDETLAGRIVLTIGADMHGDSELFGVFTPDEQAQIKARLDALHLDKIALAHEILVLNPGGYIGDSTLNEIRFAVANKKRVRMLWIPTRTRELPDGEYWINGNSEPGAVFILKGGEWVGTKTNWESPARMFPESSRWSYLPGESEWGKDI